MAPSFRLVFTNFNQPIPLPRKLWLAVRNGGLRLRGGALPQLLRPSWRAGLLRGARARQSGEHAVMAAHPTTSVSFRTASVADAPAVLRVTVAAFGDYADELP